MRKYELTRDTVWCYSEYMQLAKIKESVKIFVLSRHKKILKCCREYPKRECEHLLKGKINKRAAENLHT